MEKKGEEVVKDTLVPIKTRYLVIDNGGKSVYFTFKTLILRRTIYYIPSTSMYHQYWLRLCVVEGGGGGGWIILFESFIGTDSLEPFNPVGSRKRGENGLKMLVKS